VKLLLLLLATPFVMGAACSRIFSDEGKYFYCQFEADSLEIERLKAEDIRIVCEENATETSKQDSGSVSIP